MVHKEVNQCEETRKDGRLKGRTTAGGSSARLDDSQGKLRAEKSGRSERQVSNRQLDPPGDGLNEMKPRLQVMKFGGTSVGDAACIARTAQIIAKAAKESGCIAVVSAMSGVTNRLIEAAKKAQAGNTGAGRNFCAGRCYAD